MISASYISYGQAKQVRFLPPDSYLEQSCCLSMTAAKKWKDWVGSEYLAF